MKALVIGFVGLFGLALLASDAAAQGASRKPTFPSSPFLKGATAVCQVTSGVLIIVIKNTGDVTALACNQVNGNNIENKASIPPGLNPVVGGEPGSPGDLGTLGYITKYASPGDPDPCINWVDGGGFKNIYCW